MPKISIIICKASFLVHFWLLTGTEAIWEGCEQFLLECLCCPSKTIPCNYSHCSMILECNTQEPWNPFSVESETSYPRRWQYLDLVLLLELSMYCFVMLLQWVCQVTYPQMGWVVTRPVLRRLPVALVPTHLSEEYLIREDNLCYSCLMRLAPGSLQVCDFSV